jgi:hypothetical protein
MSFPTKTVTAYFVSACNDVADKPWHSLSGAATDGEGGLEASSPKGLSNPPVTRPRTIGEMTFETRIRSSRNLFADFIDALVPFIAVTNRQLCALFHIDDE